MKEKKCRRTVSLSSITVISITVVAIIAVSICVAVFASVYNNALMHDAEVNSEQMIGQTELAVNNYFQTMKSKLIFVKNTIEESENDAELKNKLSALTFVQDDIYAVTVYDENGGILNCVGSGAKRKNGIYKNLSFDKELFESQPEFAITPPHVQTLFDGEYPWVITVAAKLSNSRKGMYAAIDFKFSEIASYIDHVGIGRQGYCFIIDRNANIIYHPQQQILFSGLKTENMDFIKSLADGLTTDNNVIYTLKTTGSGLWRIVGISHTDEIVAQGKRQITLSIMISFLFCFFILMAVLAIYSKIVNAPIKSLIREMKRFENDAENFCFSYREESVSEIAVLYNSFGHMSERIKALMEKVRREENELRKTELKALQAQINPHFLYNTLDSIQWMCECGETKDASKMVCALAKLFRISISRGRELITIREEVDHVKNYLIIQSYRYRSQFTYKFDVDESLEECLCNKITLQPLVENAIYHGINRLVDDGEITITVKQAEDDENDILMTVSDNGVGMTEEQCIKILSKKRSDSSGIGVKNVNDRLRIYFGEKYGLSIKSELDVGTEITARIPKITKENTDEEK